MVILRLLNQSNEDIKSNSNFPIKFSLHFTLFQLKLSCRIILINSTRINYGNELDNNFQCFSDFFFNNSNNCFSHKFAKNK